jgi:hypothetical protein
MTVAILPKETWGHLLWKETELGQTWHVADFSSLFPKAKYYTQKKFNLYDSFYGKLPSEQLDSLRNNTGAMFSYVSQR